jgi:drug/metabolite transporter (DMT)-like permease
MSRSQKSILWVLLYCVCFTSAMSVNKLLSPEIPGGLKLLLRGVFGFLFLMPVVLRQGVSIFTTKAIRLQGTRMIFLALAMSGTYYTYTYLPLTLATAIGFSGPIFTATLAHYFLKDRIPLYLWGVIFFGYIGVLIMVGPSWTTSVAILVAIGANIVTGMNLIYIKKITKFDQPLTIILWGNIGLIAIALAWWMGAIYVASGDSSAYVLPDMRDFGLLVMLGLLGTISQFSYISALTKGSPSFLAPFEYFRLVVAIPIALMLGESLFDSRQLLGGAIIILTTLYLAKKGERT